MRFPIFICLFFCLSSLSLTSCSSGDGRSRISGPTFTSQIDESFISDINPELHSSLLFAEHHTLDYTPPQEDVEWRDSSGVLQGVLRASQIFNVGDMYCRRFIHTRPHLSRTIQGTVCRVEDSDWSLVE